MNDKDSEESSSDSDEDERDDGPSTSREKRAVEWCAVPTVSMQNSSPNVSWPPDPSAVGSYSWRNLRHVKPGNNYSMFGTKMQLFSKTNYNLAVYPDGVVRGTMDDKDLHSHLEVTSAGYAGHVRIRGCLANLFVAMDRKGRLYGEQPDVTEEGTVFIEAFQGSYNTYLSRKYAHLGWYLGIKKSGRFKRGPKTSYRQKAVMFLPRRSKFQ